MNIQENNIPLLADVLKEYELGTLNTAQLARKCYLSERERALGRVTWVHNDELKGHVILKKMAGSNTKDLLRNTKLM